MTLGYLVDGELIVGLQALSEKLGRTVSSKDILDRNIKGVQPVTVVTGSVEPDDIPLEKRDTTVYTALDDEDFTSLSTTPESDFRSSLPEFNNLSDFKQFVADLDTKSLEYLARGLGITWTATYHKHIHRMRISMALRKHLMDPILKVPSGKRAKYAEMTNEELVAIAISYGLTANPVNTPLDRIQIISSLNKQHFA